MKEFKKAIVYYTDSRLEEELDETVRKQIVKAVNDIPVISVSQKPLDFGNNICVGLKPRCYLSLYKQLLTGLEAIEDEDTVVYLCEHDVLYHPSHFEFIPPRKHKIYYNLNRYYWSRNINHFSKAKGKRALSQAVSYHGILLAHAKEQVQARLDKIASPCIGPFFNFSSKYPNIDIRHGGNFSSSLGSSGLNGDQRVYRLDGWGTARMIRESIKYNGYDINTRKHLHKILNPEDKPNPVEVPGFVRNLLPGLFWSLGFKKGAEIGVKKGAFSLVLCAGMKNVQLKCIDPYLPSKDVPWDEQEKRYVIARHSLKNFDAEVIKKTSLQAADEDVPKHSLDFVYIDADHSFDAVMQDIIVWSERVRTGGIVSGHDYDNEDVKTAVDAYVKIHGHELFVTEKGKKYPDANPSWFFCEGKENK